LKNAKTEYFILSVPYTIIVPKRKKAIYIFGGSATREFFDREKNLNDVIKLSTYSRINMCATSSQGLVDTLRMIENIHTPHSIVILGISPKKFWSEDPSYVEMSYLTYGKYLKYPIHSETVDALYKESNFTSSASLKVFPSASNAFLYFSKDHVLEEFKNIRHNGIKKLQFI
jgi:hypothetical protein